MLYEDKNRRTLQFKLVVKEAIGQRGSGHASLEERGYVSQ